MYIKENSSWQRRKLLHHVICQLKNRSQKIFLNASGAAFVNCQHIKMQHFMCLWWHSWSKATKPHLHETVTQNLCTYKRMLIISIYSREGKARGMLIVYKLPSTGITWRVGLQRLHRLEFHDWSYSFEKTFQEEFESSWEIVRRLLCCFLLLLNFEERIGTFTSGMLLTQLSGMFSLNAGHPWCLFIGK